MTTSRDLPNVYTTLNDMSALIEGNDSLTVGVTVKLTVVLLDKHYKSLILLIS